MNRPVAAALSLLALAGGAYAAVSVYGAIQLTTRERLLPELPPESIGSDCETVTFASRGDRKRLAGWWFPAGGDRALILVHGHGQNRLDKNWGADRIARVFRERGYGVLLFDLRGHGESEHDRLSFGVRERNDVLGALDFVRARGFAPCNCALIGISYGAAALLMAAAEMPDVGAIVADSPFADVWPVVAAEIPRRRPWLARLHPGPGIRLATRLIFGIDLAAARPIEALALLRDRPILFIHGGADAYVVPANAEHLFAAHGHPASELWLVPGAGHAQTYLTAPDEFIERVGRFIETQLAESDAETPGACSPSL